MGKDLLRVKIDWPVKNKRKVDLHP